MDHSKNTEDKLRREVETLRRRLAELENSARKFTPDNEALRQSEARYNELFNSIQEGIGIVDENEIIQFCNPAFARIFGENSPDNLIGKCLLDYIPESQRDLIRSQTEVRKSNKSSQYELEIMTARNDLKNILSSVSPRFDKNGRYIGAFGNIIDITERKRVEEALRESEERYRTLFENTVEGILVADIETKQFKYANLKVCGMLGYTEEELRKMHVGDIHPEDALERVISEFEAQAREEITLAENIPCLRKDGTIIFMDINTAKISIDGKECNVGFFRDITERKRTEKIHAILYRITEAAIQTSNLREMLEKIREILTELIDTTYFYVALHDEENDRYVFPYHADPHGDKYFQPGHLRKTITDYVRKSGKPLIADRNVFRRLGREGKLELIPQTPAIWLGAPLRTGKGVIGIVALQSFEKTTYTKADLDLLTLVSGNIAMAVERKKAMDALSESEEKYRLLIENAGEAIFTVDYDGTFLVMNKTAAQYLGGKPEELVGKTMWDIFPREISDRQMNSIRQTIRHDRGQVKEEMTLVGENERWFRTSIHPIHDSDGQITSAQLIAHDITEERQLDIRNAGRMRLLDNLRNSKDIDQCLQFGCEALHDARLFKRAVLTLNNEDRQITHLGQIGLEDNLVSAAKNSPPLEKDVVKKIVREKYKISHSFFVPVEDGLKLDDSGRYIRQKKKRRISDETLWQAGDELFVPVLGEDGKFEGWLSVDTPFNSERPSYHTVRFLEEVVDIVTQQVQEIRSREKLDLERRTLQEKNIAIKEVLAHIEEEKMGIKRLITENIDNTLLPILNKLADENKIVNSTYVHLLKSGLIDLASQSGGSQHIYAKLSPREKEICILIRGHATNKEIAEALKITIGTVRKHREAIRRKLGLTNRKVNLSAYLSNR